MPEKISEEEMKKFFARFKPKTADDKNKSDEETFSEDEVKAILEELTPNKDYLYIIQPFGLIDILCCGGLSYAAQEKKGKSATVLILQAGAKNFGIAYDNVVNIVYADPDKLLTLHKYFEKNEIHEGDNFFYGYLNPMEPKNFTTEDGLNFLDYYREKVFNLPMDTPCHPPIITPLSDEEIDSWNRRYNFDKDRTIIIAASITNKKESKSNLFWENVAARLTAKGYTIYSYISNFSEPFVANTRPIFANLRELAYLADNVKCFVSSNVVPLTILAMLNKVNAVFVNQFPAWIWDISKIFPNANVKTFYVVSWVLEVLNLGLTRNCTQITMELSHPKIDSADVFYSYDDVLDKVLDAVEQI